MCLRQGYVQMFVSIWNKIKKPEKFLAIKHLVCLVSQMLFYYQSNKNYNTTKLRMWKLYMWNVPVNKLIRISYCINILRVRLIRIVLSSQVFLDLVWVFFQIVPAACLDESEPGDM